MRERWERLLLRLKLRTALVVLVIHFGLITSIYALIELRAASAPTHLVYTMAFGICGIYGGMILGAGLVVVPILSWVRTARRLMNWREWIMDELPNLILQVPSWIKIYKDIRESIQPDRSPSTAPFTAPVTATVEPVTSSDRRGSLPD